MENEAQVKIKVRHIFKGKDGKSVVFEVGKKYPLADVKKAGIEKFDYEPLDADSKK